ncbi:hypothetical protein BDN72DRAFT_843508 [Pluteus cervinus]|uniref:Uncharacterized protein n=1 Tax=Pluteus cervinus TaxID=181527 RepID=A0ACD3AP31_9AGAR|nr:hypothetical protein BDN72DRAFT_843508 [Pluteus cervinus]
MDMPIPSLQLTIDLNCPGTASDSRSYLFRRVFGGGPLGLHDDDTYEDDLAILTTAFDITEVRQLVCKFNSAATFRKPVSMSQYKRQYTRLGMVVGRLGKVGKVMLHLEEGNAFGLHRSGAGMHDSWAESLSGLLNSCVVSARCGELEVWNGSWPKNDLNVVLGKEDEGGGGSSSNTTSRFWRFDLKLPNVRRLGMKLVNRIRRRGSPTSRMGFGQTYTYTGQTYTKPKDVSPTWKGVGWEFEALTVTGPRIQGIALSQPAQDGDIQVTRLVVATPSLLLPPHSHWLYQLFALSPSTLTSLTFQQIQFHESYWEASFSWMMATSLQTGLEELVISGCKTLPKEKLLEFVGSLKGLTRLALEHPVPVFDAKNWEGGRIELPKLKEVLVPWDWEFLFVTMQESTGSGGGGVRPQIPTQEG